MKLAPAQISSFLKNPPKEIAVALIYGADEGLVRERAGMISKVILDGATDDPFRLSNLGNDEIRQDPARLADEYGSLSLIGGRRVVRVRDAGDAIAKTVDYVLTLPPGDTTIILEADSLDARSSLRKLCEAAPRAAVIACYSDGPREVAQLIRDGLNAHRIRIDDDAVQYLTANLGNDRMVSRQELEKLSLLAGDGGSLSLHDVVASVGDSSTLAIDDVIYDAFDGRHQAIAEGLDRLFLEGVAAVSVLRAALRHGQKLHLASSQLAAGHAVDAVVKSVKPPLFFKLIDRFRAQLKDWPPRRVERALTLLTAAEFNCKRTGFPEDIICRQALLSTGRISMPKR